MTLWRPGMAVTADRLNGVVMPWTPLSELGNWSGVGAPHSANPPRMQKRVAPGGDGVWEFEGEIELPSVATNSIVTIFTFSTAHRVSREQRLSVGWNTTGYYSFWIRLLTSGTFATGLPAAATTTASTRLSLAGVRITNP
ncbi:hypothetical protein [Streptomyces lonarensis]|uniref:Uncharacterized protein n=1 Tax=Streptomyces lonarensis TaxID=700599 RepID=A0A7X6CXB1_9ACTN|nr:hypothetical protein [Streptomyces lonarensis]NJQ04297.1 hypothetical protein [Streptomyces lonarensis]